MKLAEISAGQILKLKASHPYEVETPFVRVIKLDGRWIHADYMAYVGTCRGQFRPSDFVTGTFGHDDYECCPASKRYRTK